jgi:hypothetical protein
MPYAKVESVPVKKNLLVIDKNFVVDGCIPRIVHPGWIIDQNIQRKKISESQPEVGILNPPLFESVPVLNFDPIYGLTGNELLKNSMFIDTYFLIRIANVVLAENKPITQQEVIVVFRKIISDSRP